MAVSATSFSLRMAPRAMHLARAGVLVLLLSVPPAHASNDSRLVGLWHGSYRGQALELQMNPDGKGFYQGKPIKWQLKYGQLLVDQDGEILTYAMKVEGDTLVMAGGEWASLLVMIRDPDFDARAASSSSPRTDEANASGDAPPQSVAP